MANAPGARELFDVVFFVVVIGAFAPGSTVPLVTRWLHLGGAAPPAPQTSIEIDARRTQMGEMRAYYINPSWPSPAR